MKKFILRLGIVLTAFAGVIGMLYLEYLNNDRQVSAVLHTVSVTPYREQQEFSSPITQYGNLYLMSGAIREITNLAVGDAATVYHNGKTYQGYIYRLEQVSNGFYYATVSVVKMNAEPIGNATAVILGKNRQHIIYVPDECVFTDETGKDAVFVVQEGYAMLRQVQTGPLTQEGKIPIEQGLFATEKIVVSPQNIREGDRVFAQKSP